jgi:hypothetical protein
LIRKAWILTFLLVVLVISTLPTAQAILENESKIVSDNEVSLNYLDLKKYTFNVAAGDKLHIWIAADGAIDILFNEIGHEIEINGINATFWKTTADESLIGHLYTVRIFYDGESNLMVSNTHPPVKTVKYSVIVTKFWQEPGILSSSISCEVQPLDTEVGEDVEVSGLISPALLNIPVTLTYGKPDGLKFNRTITTGLDGKFSDTYTVDAAGLWKITASWEGNEYYIGAVSTPAFLTVEEKAAANPWQTPLGWLIIFTALAAIIGLPVTLIRQRRRSSKTHPSSTPPPTIISCINCGRRIAPHMIYCPRCGQKVG